MSQHPTRPNEKTVDESVINNRKLSEEEEEEETRAFYEHGLVKLAELNKHEQTLENLPPPQTAGEIKERESDRVRIEEERKEILDALERDGAIDILFGDAEPREYHHQSRDVTEGSQLSFYNNGDHWTLGKKGQESHLKNLKGLRSIHFLLQHPNRKIQCLDVYYCGSQPRGADILPEYLAREADGVHRSKPLLAKEDTDTISETPAEMMDACTHAKIKEKIAEYEVEIVEIRKNPTGNPEHDFERIQTLEAEKLKLNKYVSNATRPGGRIKHFDEPDVEKLRKNLQKNIRSALERIKNRCPDLVPFLNTETISTGKQCCYNPDPQNTPEWILYKPSR